MANQLWNDMALYAYALERGYSFETWPGFEYANYFGKKPKNLFIRVFFWNPFLTTIKNKWIRKMLTRKIFKKIFYELFSRIFALWKKKQVVCVKREQVQLQALSEENENGKMLCYFSTSPEKNLYFFGWPFRNGAEMEKHRDAIFNYVFSKKELLAPPHRKLSALREKYNHVVGVHFRQGDFRTVPQHHIWCFTEKEIRDMLDAYLVFSKKSIEETVFVICSDEPFSESSFLGLNIASGVQHELSDLYLLSQTDIILGSKSTFGEFAAFVGNKTFVVFERNGIAWDYYRGKNRYFENKKSMLNSAL